MIEILDSNLKKVDILRKYTFSQYIDKFREVGTFKLNVRIEKENLYLMDETEQYYVLFDGKTFGRIDKVRKDSDSEFEKVLEITGKLAPVLFTERVVNGTLTFSGNTAQYVRELIYQNIVKDATKNRYVNIDIQYDDETYLNSICSKVDKQTTGGYVWDEVQPVLEQDKLGIFFTPIVRTKHTVDGVETNISEWELKIGAGKDRRKGNRQGNRPVVFSQSLSNIARTTYDHETEKYKNIAYVAGEGEEQERKWYEIGINAGIETKNKKGWGCRELWIDARDIQSEDSDGNTIRDEEYEKLIKQRANEKATENTVERSYSSTITEANNQYEYGKDYYKGDFVTVIDNELGITVDAQVTEVTVTVEGTRKVVDVDFTYGKVNRDPVEQIKDAIQKSETNDSNIKYLENKTIKMEQKVNDISAYVIESGKYKVWNYKKWSDGTIEMEGVIKFSGTMNTSQTTATVWKEFRFPVSDTGFPVVLVEDRPEVVASPAPGADAYLFVIGTNADKEHLSAMSIARYDTTTLQAFTAKVSVRVVGKWK